MTAIGGRNRDYGPFDRLRIRTLILCSSLPLVVALSGLTLLSAQIQPTHAWSLISFGAAAFMAGMWLSTIREGARVQRTEDPQQPARRRYRVVFFSLITTSLVALLLYNGLVLFAFWPILLSCSYQLVTGVWLVLHLLLEEH